MLIRDENGFAKGAITMKEEQAKKAVASLPYNSAQGLNIPDFCDMELFEQIMEDWATSTGLATVAVGSDGKYVSGCYNFTDFCQKLTRKSPEGLRRCIECDQKGTGIYLCHAGLVDFATSITLEDGTLLGNIIGGQVLPKQPDEAKYRATARKLGIDENLYIDALRKVNVRSQEEICASAHLLATVVNLFVRTSYAAKQNAKSLKERAHIISSLNNIYFCTYYIDLAADNYVELDAREDLHAFTGSQGKASAMLTAGCELFADAWYVKDFAAFTDLTTLKERLGKRSSIAFEFIGRSGKWNRSSFIVVDYDRQGGVSHVIYAVQGIEEEKEKELQAQRALKQAAEEATRANQVKSEFLARMSHDMRTPLTTIIGLSDIACARYEDEKLLEYFKTIKNSSQYLLAILTDVLDMQKLASGKVPLQLKVCDSCTMVETIDAMIRPAAEAKQIEFHAEFKCKDLQCYPLADTRLIQQLLINLLNNAVKYTQPGGRVSWTMQLAGETEDTLVFAHTITDNGKGMSADFMQVMYEPFTQGSMGSGVGHGLGLAIVKRLVELMHGTIDCQSAPGKGTSFTITLPHAKASAAEIAAYERAKHMDIAASSFEHCRVLVCEDNLINARIIQSILQLKAIDSEHAKDGREAVQKAQTGKYQAILMDIRMPLLDGYAATEKIREFDKTTPIIALSANNFPDDIKKSLASGMNAHLAKPIDTKQLYSTLNKVLHMEH